MPGLTPSDFPSITGDYGDYAVFSYLHLNSGSGTTGQVKTGVALLHTVTVNVVGGAGAQITLSDGTSGSGPTIAVVDLTKQVPYTYDVKANNGLFYTLAGTLTGLSCTIAYV